MSGRTKIYIETTIPSYVVGRLSNDIRILANQKVTRDWWENEKNKYDLFVSEAVEEEVAEGDKNLSQQRLELISDISLLQTVDEVMEIADKYLNLLDIPERARPDAVHIAFAVYYEIDILLTLNCTHIANAYTRMKLHKINKDLGYMTPEICTPQELMED